jgi:hypothetical protein
MHSSVAGSSPQGNSRSIDPLKLRSKARLRFETEEEVCGQHKKAISFELRTSDAQLTRYLGDQYGDDLPAHKVAYLTRGVGPGYMEWLARESGGVYHHGESGPPCHESVKEMIGLLAQQSGNVIQQLLKHLDKHIAKREDLPGLRKLRAIVEEVIAIEEGGGR